MAKKTSFLLSGKKAQQAYKSEKTRQKERRGKGGLIRWWLPHDSEGKLTFLDTPKFYFYEHRLQLNGSWHNYFTCIKDIDPDVTCPLCDQTFRRSLVLVATVISHREWTDRKGKTHKNQKQVLVAPGTAMEKIQRQIQRKKDLQFCVYTVARGSGQTECGCGEDWEFEQRLDKKALLKLKPKDFKGTAKEWLSPIDYAEYFAPKSYEQLAKLVGVDEDDGVDADEIEPYEGEDEDEELDEDEEQEEDEEDEDDEEDELDEEDEPEEEEKPKKTKKKETKKKETKKKTTKKKTEDDDEEEGDRSIESLLK